MKGNPGIDFEAGLEARQRAEPAIPPKSLGAENIYDLHVKLASIEQPHAFSGYSVVPARIEAVRRKLFTSEVEFAQLDEQDFLPFRGFTWRFDKDGRLNTRATVSPIFPKLVGDKVHRIPVLGARFASHVELDPVIAEDL